MKGFQVFLLCAVGVSLGRAFPMPSIVGGNVTDITKVPYQAAFLLHNSFCGAAIIAKNYLLTAAHCCMYQKLTYMKVRVGSNSFKMGGVVLKVNQTFIHPKYSNILDPAHDACVLQTDRRMKFTKKIKPIKIGNKTPTTGIPVFVAGWGDTSEGGNFSTVIRSVYVPVADPTNCHKIYPFIPDVTGVICAGEKGKDSCQGDSGGALVWNNMLVGIVSLGYGCGRLNIPGVYANAVSPEIRKFVKDVAGV